MASAETKAWETKIYEKIQGKTDSVVKQKFQEYMQQPNTTKFNKEELQKLIYLWKKDTLIKVSKDRTFMDSLIQK